MSLRLAKVNETMVRLTIEVEILIERRLSQGSHKDGEAKAVCIPSPGYDKTDGDIVPSQFRHFQSDLSLFNDDFKEPGALMASARSSRHLYRRDTTWIGRHITEYPRN